MICGIHAPEDLEATPDGRHLVMSETPGLTNMPGALAMLDIANRVVTQLPRPRDHGSIWGDQNCSDPGEAATFKPHGIHLSVRPGGGIELLVVDHAHGETIEFYQLMQQAGQPVAAWRGCVANSGRGMFNDVANTPDGGFVATVMFDKPAVYLPDGSLRPGGLASVLTGRDTGYLVAWSPHRPLHKLAGSDAPFNNGIQVSADGKTIWFAAWTGRQLRTYDVSRARTSALLDLDFLPDNISVATSGDLIAAGLPTMEQFTSCLKEAASCTSGLKVMQWNPKSGKSKLLFEDSSGLIGGASVALRLNDTLYIGSFAADRVLIVKLTRQ